jgi:hypothetical protein
MARKPLDPLDMFMHAEDYRITAIDLARDNNPARMSRVALPATVLGAFASEVYLKCILCLQGKTVPALHNLRDLFDLIGEPTKTRLQVLWSTIVPDLPSRKTFWALGDQEYGGQLPRDLPTLLEMGARAFEQLRYSYERDEDPVFVLNDFPGVARMARRDNQRHIRISDDGAERRYRPDPPEGHACHFNDARGSENVVGGAGSRSFAAAAPVARRCVAHRGARAEARRRGERLRDGAPAHTPRGLA